MVVPHLSVGVLLLALCLTDATDYIDSVRLEQLQSSRIRRAPTYSSAANKPTPTQHFEHDVQLDVNGDYWLFWTANDTHITFETHVNTQGYIGFGLSPNGKMYPADVVLGGVKDGQAYFKDYHTTQHSQPVLDSSQDWILLAGKETASGTVLTFVRKLNTCDSTDDMEITDDTMRIIYSYHPEDITSYAPYHGATRRGAKSVMLLSASLTEEDVHMPSDAITLDFLHDNFHVPSDTTTYSCRGFQLPPLPSKHHMIKYEPVITPGNELNVHHALIFKCDGHRNMSQYHGTVFRCDHSGHIPHEMRSCLSKVVIAWAIGGKVFYYPPHAGYSMGTNEDPSFFVMETHYDNPMARSDIIDSSGIRITLTPTLRKHDAGLLEIGVGVSNLQIIPPMEPAFVSQGFCPSEILQTAVPPEGVNIFAGIQHSHLLGKEMYTRIYRNGRELQPLAVDKNYDFDFQDVRYFKEERKLLPGDKLEVKCVYNSMNKRRPVYGGLSTEEEMCLTFLIYYPRVPLDACLSLPLYTTIDPDAHKIHGIVRRWNWTDPEVRAKLRTALDNSVHIHYSNGDIKAANKQVMTTEHPTNYPYVAPKDDSCKRVNPIVDFVGVLGK